MIKKNKKIIKNMIRQNKKIIIIIFLFFALLTILYLFNRYSGFSVGAPGAKGKKGKKVHPLPPVQLQRSLPVKNAWRGGTLHGEVTDSIEVDAGIRPAELVRDGEPGGAPRNEDLGPQPEPEALPGNVGAGTPLNPELRGSMEIAGTPRNSELRGSMEIAGSGVGAGGRVLLNPKLLRKAANNSLIKSRLVRNSRNPPGINMRFELQQNVDSLKLDKIKEEMYNIRVRSDLIRGLLEPAMAYERDKEGEFRVSRKAQMIEILKRDATTSEKNKLKEYLEKYYSQKELETYKKKHKKEEELLANLLIDMFRTRPSHIYDSATPIRAYMSNRKIISSDGSRYPELSAHKASAFGASVKYDKAEYLDIMEEPNIQSIRSLMDNDRFMTDKTAIAKAIVTDVNLMENIIAPRQITEADRAQFVHSLGLNLTDFKVRKNFYGQVASLNQNSLSSAVFSGSKYNPTKLGQSRGSNAKKAKQLLEVVSKGTNIKKTINMIPEHLRQDPEFDHLDREKRFRVSYVAKLAEQGNIPPENLELLMEPYTQVYRSELLNWMKEETIKSVTYQKKAMKAVSDGNSEEYVEILKQANVEYQTAREAFDKISDRFKQDEQKSRSEIEAMSDSEKDIYATNLDLQKKYLFLRRSTNLLKNIGNQQIGTLGTLQVDEDELRDGLDAITEAITDDGGSLRKTSVSIENLRNATKKFLDSKKKNAFNADVDTEAEFRMQYAKDKIFEDFLEKSRELESNPSLVGYGAGIPLRTKLQGTDASSKAFQTQLELIIKRSIYVHTFERSQLDLVIGRKRDEIREQLERLSPPERGRDHDYIILNQRFIYLTNLPTQINRNLAPEQLYNIAEHIQANKSPDVTGMESLIDYKGREALGWRKHHVGRIAAAATGAVLLGGVAVASGGGASILAGPLAGAAVGATGPVSGGIMAETRTRFKRSTKGISRNTEMQNGSWQSRTRGKEAVSNKKFFLEKGSGAGFSVAQPVSQGLLPPLVRLDPLVPSPPPGPPPDRTGGGAGGGEGDALEGPE